MLLVMPHDTLYRYSSFSSPIVSLTCPVLQYYRYGIGTRGIDEKKILILRQLARRLWQSFRTRYPGAAVVRLETMLSRLR